MRPAAIIRRQRWQRQVGRLAALILLAGCATPKAPSAPAAVPVPPVEPSLPLAQLQAYAVKPAIGTECVPYARQRSGIGIMGDAYTWWDTAAGRYQRGSLPLAGAVLVLRKSDRLRRGHLAVVTAVVGPREIRVDHANWQADALITGMAVMDVSPKNDWTQLRFWNKDARMWGRIYPAAGFIYNVPDGVVPPGATTLISGNGKGDGTPQQSTP
jgi:surface antigen